MFLYKIFDKSSIIDLKSHHFQEKIFCNPLWGDTDFYRTIDFQACYGPDANEKRNWQIYSDFSQSFDSPRTKAESRRPVYRGARRNCRQDNRIEV